MTTTTSRACDLFGSCCSISKSPGQFMDELMVLLGKSDGRDKVNKALQYAAKLVVFGFELEIARWKRNGKIPVEGFASRDTVIAQMEKVFTSLGQARKVFRFFKFYNGYMSFFSLFTNKRKQLKKLDFPRLLSLFCTFSMANYFAADNVVWLFKAGLITERKLGGLFFGADSFNKLSNLSWLHALLVTILLDGWELFQIRKEETSLRQKIASTPMEIQQEQQSESGEITVVTNKDELAVLSQNLDGVCKKRTKLYFDIAKNVCDVGLATSALKYWSPNNGILGFCGVLSAMIGICQTWPSA